MKNLVIILLVVLTSLFVFSSCESESSADVNQDRIYTLYEIIYNEADDLSYARATFFFGGITGTRLELASPSVVTANTESLGYKSTLAYYEHEFAGYVQTCEFVWKDTEENSFTNTVSIKEIGFPETLDTIVKGVAYELTWVGEVLDTGESVWAYVDGTAENDEVLATQNTQNAVSIFLTATQTEKLSVGTNTIKLTRKNTIDGQEITSAGGSCTGTYETETIEIEVKE
ncbi:MAG TPA: hypothetical protein PLL66_03560 [Bacteroidales bacterium]|nr:hypothetical protein [Bacteroidales bacterium]